MRNAITDFIGVEMTIVQAQNLSHRYGKFQALDGVNLEIQQGQCFALLGPNGAGKTTFVKIMLGLQSPEAGTLSLFSKLAGTPSARSNIGYLPEKFSFYPYYKVKDTLAFHAAVAGLSKDETIAAVSTALSKLKIPELAEKKLSGLSKGQLQRVGLASLLLGDKQLLILDEPFSGLDPIGIKDLKELLRELKAAGKTLLINSHILSEVEPLCDHFGILNKGKLLVAGEKNSLLKGKSLEDFFSEIVQ